MLNRMLGRRVRQPEEVASQRDAFMEAIQGITGAVTRYFSKLGHVCVCDIQEAPHVMCVLVTIISPPTETAAAIALAIDRLEQRMLKALSRPVRVYVTFRSEKGKASGEAAVKTASRIELAVEEIDFDEFQKHATAA